MKTPTFSVVIPTYNRANAVITAVYSVLAQDTDDFEIVVVDDGSSDDSILQLCAVSDSRIRLFWQNNAGGGAARARGICEARGRYIAFLDSDDQFLPDKLSTMSREHPGDSDIVLYSLTYVDRGVNRFWVRPDRGIVPGEDVGEYLFCANQIMQTSTLVVPTALARKVSFDPTLRRGQDLDFCVRLQAAGARFRMIEEPLTIWLDASEAGRTSYACGSELSLAWLEKCGCLLTLRARRGYRATVLAYHLAKVKPFIAARDLAVGWLCGGVSARITVRQALRAYLPKPIYRTIINLFVFCFGNVTQRNDLANVKT